VSAEAAVTVVDVPGEHRYAIRVGNELAGFAQYRLRPDAVAFTHTEIDDRFEGQGLGGKLVAFALDDVRGRGLAALPICPFVRGYIERHPEYLELVPAERRGEFDL